MIFRSFYKMIRFSFIQKIQIFSMINANQLKNVAKVDRLLNNMINESKFWDLDENLNKLS